MTKVTVWIGEYEVVEVKGQVISVHLGRGVCAHFHMIAGITHGVKVGDKVPLLTEVPICPPLTN